MTILGAGVLGRRIAATWVAAGYNIVIRDPFEAARNAAIHYIDQNLSEYSKLSEGDRKPGSYKAYEDLKTAVKDAFLVIEVCEILSDFVHY